ncbi:MAG: nucleotidyltransferase domain-containing protein [Geminicoccaceae bacterium]
MLACYRARVLAAFPGRIERIVVFGSRARGDPHGESDWDFAVFFRQPPGESESDRLADLDWELGQSFGGRIQSLELAREAWLASNELACNIRDHGLIIYGPNDVPTIKRPVMRHARDALAKAERFAELSAETPDARFEGVIHGAYYAMFHGARAALLAAEGSASTKHGRVVDAFVALVKRRYRAEAARHAAALLRAYRHRITADYGNTDLTAVGRRLRDRVAPLLAFCRELVEGAAHQP